MAGELRLTTSEIASCIERTTGRKYSTWRVRRILDAMEADGEIDVQRCGLYRTVASADVSRVAEQLGQREPSHV